MNVMLASGGYPWTVIPLQRRDAYMAALDDASVRQNILPFADFLGQLVKKGLRGKPVAKVPSEERKKIDQRKNLGSDITIPTIFYSAR